MIQDTLVALDWDGKTPMPLLAKSWTVSPDGKTYTFKLRDDVSVLQRQEVHRRRRGLQLQPPEATRATKAPFAWRAGNIKELRAPDPYTVEYELNEPFSDLLVQLTMFNNASTTRTASSSWARTTASRASTAPAPGAS
jgi:peptide/nickel transport system substrate-binding protein